MNSITCVIRAHWLEKRCKNSRRIKEFASVKIQSVFRHYSAKLKECRGIQHLRTIHAIDLVTAQFRGSVARSCFVKKRKAALEIQRLARRNNAKLRQISIKYESKKNMPIQSEVEIETLDLWRLWTVKVVLHHKVTKNVLIRRIQKTWRIRKQFKIKRRQYLRLLCYRWVHSFLAVTRYESQARFASASAIQRCWRHRQDWQSRIRRIRAADKEEKERKSATNLIAMVLQSRWRAKIRQQVLREMLVETIRRTTRQEAATILQCWYRQRRSKCTAERLQKVVAIWNTLAKAVMRRNRKSLRFTIYNWYLHCEEEEQLQKAALTLTLKIGALHRKRKQMKLLCRTVELNAVLCIQSWWRLKAQRLWLLKHIVSVKRIQRMWKAIKCRHTILKIYKQGRSRRLLLEARSKKDILKLRIERKMLNLFKRAKENAAVAIQKEYRKYIKIKHAKKEETRLLDMQKSGKANELEEWERLDDIIRHKQGKRKLMQSITKVMGKVNMTSLRIIDNIRAHRRESLEPSLARYHLLKSSMKGTKSTIQDVNVKFFEEKLLQTFRNSNWWNKECLELSFQYLLWPKDFDALRRYAVHQWNLFTTLRTAPFL